MIQDKVRRRERANKGRRQERDRNDKERRRREGLTRRKREEGDKREGERERRDQGSCVDNSVVDRVEPIMDDQELLKRN